MKPNKLSLVCLVVSLAVTYSNNAFSQVETLIIANDSKMRHCHSKVTPESKRICFKSIESEEAILKLLEKVKDKYSKIDTIRFGLGTDVTNPVFETILKLFPSIRELELRHTSADNPILYITQLTELRSLRMSYHFTPEFIAALAGIPEANPTGKYPSHLKELHLFGAYKDITKIPRTTISSGINDSFISLFSKFKNLHRLEISWGTLTDAGVEKLAQFSDLKYLRIVANEPVLNKNIKEAFKNHKYLSDPKNLEIESMH